MADKGFTPEILVIDDERDIREGCQRILSRMDCKVHVATNGQDGLDTINSKNICMVVCDIKMPGMDGLEVLRQIKDNNPDIVVVMITGFSTVETAIEAMKKGAYDFISKPFSPDQLRMVARRAIEKLRLEQQAQDLKKAREQNLADLDTEQSRLRTIVESLPNGVLVTNMAGQIVLMNPTARAFLNLPGNAGLGENIRDCIKYDCLCQYLMDVAKSSSSDETMKPCELGLGDERYVLAQGKPVKSEDGQSLGAVVNLSDISDMKLFDRLKSEFVAKVSHELRSPLSIIHQQLAMVMRKGSVKSQDDSSHILGRAKEKTQTLISMISELLDISRIEAGNNGQTLVEVRVDKLLSKIVEFMDAQAKEKKQSLKLGICEKDIPLVIADPIALESVFSNLIANAIKYTPDKGEILVRADVTDDMIRVRVKDNGFGMEAKHLSKIFEKFYRIKDDNTRFINGTGLGLPIAKSLVEALNGKISVESQIGKGSEFTILLPAG